MHSGILKMLSECSDKQKQIGPVSSNEIKALNTS